MADFGRSVRLDRHLFDESRLGKSMSVIGRQVRRIVVSCFTALVGVAVIAAPANAHTVDIWTQSGTLGGGGAHVYGSLGFTDGNSMWYSMSVVDRCPGDTYGVSFYFELDLVGGGLTSLTQYFGQNTAGCEHHTELASGGVNRTKNIVRVRTIQCYTNDGNPCFMVPSGANNSGIGGWKTNNKL